METLIASTETVPPVSEPMPETPPDTTNATDEVDVPSFWDRYLPRDVPFFKMFLMDRLVRRSYHAIDVEGPFDQKKMAEDNRERTFRSEANINRSGYMQTVRLLLRLDGDVFAYLEQDSLKIYGPTPEAAQAAAKKFRTYVLPQKPNQPFFHVISLEEHGPVAVKVSVERKAPIATEELALHYGIDFPAWEREWRDRLCGAPSGLTIFHGPPGCGKTSYLRALMARLLDKAVFYFLPVSESEMLSNPRFVSFWINEAKKHPKKLKVVLLEDAEELLLPRDVGSRDKVSNLLNLADGFLGDHLKLHVVATTNAPVRQLDPAILRPGRLLGMREFRRLTRPEAERLAQAKGLVLPEQLDFSLAEVYCGATTSLLAASDRQIGFAQ